MSLRDRPGIVPLDLAIIGGGVAGAYVAYRMAALRPQWRIAVYECSGRIGGRLLSVRVPGIERVRAELGGMRFRTSQPLIMQLVDEMRLEIRPFRTVFDDNRFFLRGSRWPAGVPAGARAAYHLAADERDRTPAEVLVMAFERAVPGALQLSDEQWVEVKRTYRFHNRLLRDWTMRDLLAALLSPEGHRYVVDGFGYDTLLEERSAADAMPWILIEARPEAENYTLVDGMEQLPRELAARFAASGGDVQLKTEILAVAHDNAAEGGRFRLSAGDGPDVQARRVVFAVPQPALRGILARSPLLADAGLGSMLGAVTAHPAAKLFLTYDRAWWRETGFRGMRGVTDLPLSKTYYFDFDEIVNAAGRPGLLLASYSDGSNRDAWRTMSPRGAPIDEAPYDSLDRWSAYSASSAQVTEAQQQVRLCHPTEAVPEPTSSAFMDWDMGAWHVWNVGARSWEVMDSIVQPLEGVELYICGEAFAWSQGWVEGALETADRVVKRLTLADGKTVEASPARTPDPLRWPSGARSSVDQSS